MYKKVHAFPEIHSESEHDSESEIESKRSGSDGMADVWSMHVLGSESIGM